MLQWRDKARDKGEQLPDLRAIYALCIDRQAILIVNDHADLALVLDNASAPRTYPRSAPLPTMRPLTPRSGSADNGALRSPSAE
jgi:hypothetical protein